MNKMLWAHLLNLRDAAQIGTAGFTANNDVQLAELNELVVKGYADRTLAPALPGHPDRYTFKITEAGVTACQGIRI